jgi:hypothetical protein
VVDATSAVMTYGDVLTWMPEPTPTAPAIKVGDLLVPHASLEEWARGVLDRFGECPPGARVLVAVPADALADGLAVALAVLALDGSVVLCAPGINAVARQRIARAELVVAQVAAD